MDFAKIKTILITLLLCVNVFLGVVSLAQNHSKKTISAQTVINTVDALALVNISVETEVIPRRKPDVKVARLTLESGFAQKTGQALFPQGFDIKHQEGDSIWIEADTGSFRLLAKSELVFEKHSGLKVDLTADYAQDCVNDFLSHMNIKKSEYEIFSNTVTETGARRVTVGQKINGKRLFDAVITAQIDKDGKQYFVGRWVFGRLESELDASGSDVLNMLFDFSKHMGYVKTTVKVVRIDNGFLYFPGGNSTLKEARVFPAWTIETDDGCTYYYDAVKGDFVEVEIIGC